MHSSLLTQVRTQCAYHHDSYRLTSVLPDEYSEHVLQATIEEVDRLRSLFTTMSPLLKLIERREWIKEEMKRFEVRASDPDRFKGSSARLLQEAKFRKVMSKVGILLLLAHATTTLPLGVICD
jgi:hypothetical protein